VELQAAAHKPKVVQINKEAQTAALEDKTVHQAKTVAPRIAVLKVEVNLEAIKEVLRLKKTHREEKMKETNKLKKKNKK
jgi:hypothetical protein